MPRSARAAAGAVCYHVVNRGDARREIFLKDGDYQVFLEALGHVCVQVPMRVLAYCLMPNHFHIVVWLQWLLNAPVRRYHQHYRSSGHIWRGRPAPALFRPVH